MSAQALAPQFDSNSGRYQNDHSAATIRCRPPRHGRPLGVTIGLSGPLYGSERSKRGRMVGLDCVQSSVTLRRSFHRPSEPIPTGSRKYDFIWYNSLMRATVSPDVGSYSYAGMGYANPHAVTSVGGTSHTYDNNGNVTAIGSLDYTWDWRNRLASAERSGGGITTYGYDHTGQRVFQATVSATTSYPNRYHNVASSSLTATTTKHIFSPDGTLLATVVGLARRMPPRPTCIPITLVARTSLPMKMGGWCRHWITTPTARSASPPASSPSSAALSARSTIPTLNPPTSTHATTKARAASS